MSVTATKNLTACRLHNVNSPQALNSYCHFLSKFSFSAFSIVSGNLYFSLFGLCAYSVISNIHLSCVFIDLADLHSQLLFTEISLHYSVLILLLQTCRSRWLSGRTPDCGARGPRFESHCGRSCLSRQSLQYTALSTGCAPLLQCLGRLSLPPSVGR